MRRQPTISAATAKPMPESQASIGSTWPLEALVARGTVATGCCTCPAMDGRVVDVVVLAGTLAVETGTRL
jgi:hypothetical protein